MTKLFGLGKLVIIFNLFYYFRIDLKSTELEYLRTLCRGIYDCVAEYVQLLPRK